MSCCAAAWEEGDSGDCARCKITRRWGAPAEPALLWSQRCGWPRCLVARPESASARERRRAPTFLSNNLKFLLSWRLLAGLLRKPVNLHGYHAPTAMLPHHVHLSLRRLALPSSLRVGCCSLLSTSAHPPADPTSISPRAVAAPDRSHGADAVAGSAVPGAVHGPGDRMVIMYTCMKCETRSARVITKVRGGGCAEAQLALALRGIAMARSSETALSQDGVARKVCTVYSVHSQSAQNHLRPFSAHSRHTTSPPPPTHS